MARPSVVKAVAEMLEGEWPDAQTLAKAIVKEVEERNAQYDLFLLGLMVGEIPVLYGPFATQNAAAKAAEKMNAPHPMKGRVMKIWPIADAQM